MTTVLGFTRGPQPGIVQRVPTSRQKGIIKHENAVSLYPFDDDDLMNMNETLEKGEKVNFKVDRRGYATFIRKREP